MTFAENGERTTNAWSNTGLNPHSYEIMRPSAQIRFNESARGRRYSLPRPMDERRRSQAVRFCVRSFKYMAMIARFFADEAGVSAVKYGLIAACISLAIVTVLHGVAPKVMDAVAAAE